ncbi:uncharacterized protein PgNI_01289, partial [Pyricularia grisea]|uniref:Uncharacterized protein n=1 Tax=Pyricularia grisea TaxID=148305 RepID=A0A6P8BJT1_PYRGI
KKKKKKKKKSTAKTWLAPIQHKKKYNTHTERERPTSTTIPKSRRGGLYREGVRQNISAGQEKRRCDEPGDGQASHIFQRDASPVDGS